MMDRNLKTKKKSCERLKKQKTINVTNNSIEAKFNKWRKL